MQLSVFQISKTMVEIIDSLYLMHYAQIVKASVSPWTC